MAAQRIYTGRPVRLSASYSLTAKYLVRGIINHPKKQTLRVVNSKSLGASKNGVNELDSIFVKSRDFFTFL